MSRFSLRALSLVEGHQERDLAGCLLAIPARHDIVGEIDVLRTFLLACRGRSATETLVQLGSTFDHAKKGQQGILRGVAKAEARSLLQFLGIDNYGVLHKLHAGRGS